MIYEKGDLLPVPPSVGLGGAACCASEEAGEVVGVVNAYLIAQLVDLDVGGFEHPRGFLYLQLVEVVERALTGLFAKDV